MEKKVDNEVDTAGIYGFKDIQFRVESPSCGPDREDGFFLFLCQKVPIKITVLLKRDCMGFHVSLGECIDFWTQCRYYL